MTEQGAGSGLFESAVHRRAVLSGLAAGCLACAIRPAVAQTGVPQEAFLDLSRFLTGRESLNREQSARLFEALAEKTADFGAEVAQLGSRISERNLDAGRLQQTLDSEGSALAGLPRQIMSAWYTGIVGEGGAARCVTFETSLMHQLVADRLDPPSYCYGPHASWSDAPV